MNDWNCTFIDDSLQTYIFILKEERKKKKKKPFVAAYELL